MILPNKYIPTRDSLLGRASVLLGMRRKGGTVSQLWYSYRKVNPDVTFDAFLDTLTLLYAVGLVSLKSGILEWAS